MDYFSANKLRNKGVTALIVLNVIAIILLVILVVKPFRPHQPRGPKHMLETELELTDEQKSEYRALIKSHRSKMHELREKINEARKEYFAELGGTKNNKALAKIGQLQTEIESNTLQHFLDFKQLLTPEQQAEFENIYQDVLGAMAGPKPGHRPPPPPHH